MDSLTDFEGGLGCHSSAHTASYMIATVLGALRGKRRRRLDFLFLLRSLISAPCQSLGCSLWMVETGETGVDPTQWSYVSRWGSRQNIFSVIIIKWLDASRNSSPIASCCWDDKLGYHYRPPRGTIAADRLNKQGPITNQILLKHWLLCGAARVLQTVIRTRLWAQHTPVDGDIHYSSMFRILFQNCLNLPHWRGLVK